MEKKNLEIERFKKKAKYYKKAISISPNARILEIFNIVSVLDGFIHDNELDKSSLCIIDLMSGDGFLTKHLYKMGFRNIHAFEACNEMSFNSVNYNLSGVKLYSIPEILEIEKILCNLKPKIIVSLASFHHLIVNGNEETKSINAVESFNLQQKVVDICMRNLEEDGLFLIIDIYDSIESADDFITGIPLWKTKDSINLLINTFKKETVRQMQRSKNQTNLSYFIDNSLTNYSFKRNPSINWFREVVNKYTSIGHDDLAINKNLVEYIKSKHTVRYNTFACPWVFESKDILTSFLLNKFGFVIDNETKISESDVIEKAGNINGLTPYNDDKILFGWNLSMLIISKTNSVFEKKSNKKRIAFILFLLIIVLLINISTNAIFIFYNKTVIDITNSISFILVGYLIPDTLAFIRKKIFRN